MEHCFSYPSGNLLRPDELVPLPFLSTELHLSTDGPIPPINTMAEPISPNAVSVSWEFPVDTGPPPEVGGRRPDIYYTVRVSNPETG